MSQLNTCFDRMCYPPPYPLRLSDENIKEYDVFKLRGSYCIRERKSNTVLLSTSLKWRIRKFIGKLDHDYLISYV